MQYKLATKFDKRFLLENSMGPNPAKLLEEALDTIHDCAHWRTVIEATEGMDILAIQELDREHFDECWQEWLDSDNEYAVGDRASMNAGAGDWMNFVLIALRRR